MGSRTTTNGPAGRSEESVAELIQRATQQTQTLVRDEIRLAQLELTEKGKRAGMGIGLFGGAGGLAAYGFAALLAGLIMLLATAVDGWVAAFIVAAALFAVAGVLALTGKKEIDQATPARPEAAEASARQDVDHVKARARK